MSQDLGKKIKQTKKPQTTAKQKKKKKTFIFSELTFSTWQNNNYKRTPRYNPIFSLSPQVPYFLTVVASDSSFATQLLEI